MKRRDFISLLGGATAWPLAARAQQVTKIPRMGVLTPGRSDSSDASLRTLNAFMSALPELGYTEGQNIAIERKFGEGHADRLRGLATELVERQVDVIVVFSTPAARAAKQATTTIPIVAIAMADPVADELVASLAQPRGECNRDRFSRPRTGLQAPTVA
ncbi:MAG: ABC transporter substrate binding protein [Pseudolabrys sp.]